MHLHFSYVPPVDQIVPSVFFFPLVHRLFHATARVNTHTSNLDFRKSIFLIYFKKSISQVLVFLILAFTLLFNFNTHLVCCISAFTPQTNHSQAKYHISTVSTGIPIDSMHACPHPSPLTTKKQKS